ncbi:MAG: VanZ family protein [Phycisphaerales bacterium]|nr:MAG: VanZ family protein [Phycisphaerales bacterium]
MSYLNRKRLLIAVIFTAFILLLTHLPRQAVPLRLNEGGFDKLVHSLGYGAITLLFVLSLKTRSIVLSALILLFVISAVATFDELTQPLVNRIASTIDWLADVVGILAVLMFSVVCRVRSVNAAPKP